jgi:zinc protease
MTRATPRLYCTALVIAATSACVGTPAPRVEPATPVTQSTIALPPPPLAGRTIAFPDFHESVLPNGVRLIVVEHGTQPVASVNLYVRSGSAADPAQQAGLAGMAAELLTKGTQTRSATQIAESIENVGGRISAGAAGDWISVSATSLAENLPLALELVSDVALRPTFPAEEVELARRRTLSGLQAALGQPGEIARRRFLREIYGEAHPYGTMPIPGTVQGLEQSHLQQFHSRHFTPGNALLVVAGQVTRAQVEQLARQHFGGWQGSAAPSVTMPVVPARQQTTIYLVHRPGSVQSNIWVGHGAVRPDDPDFFALQVLNRILGGGTDARLFQILREEKGWTYGSYSNFTRPADVGYFSATAEVRTEVTDSAVAEIVRQLRRLQQETVPTEEFEFARDYLAGSFPLRIETAGQVASQVAQARLLGLPVEDVTQYVQRIRAVTAADVQRVAQRHIRPEGAAIVIVGDATQILSGLEPMAPVRLYDVEGQPIERSALQVRASSLSFDATRLRPQTLTYQLIVQGNAMGTATEQLRRDGDAWVGTSGLNSPVMQQESEVRFDATDLSPIRSSMAAGQGASRVSVNLEITDGRVRGRAELPPEAGGVRDIDMEAVGGMLLPGMDPYVLALATLRDGASMSLPVFNPMSGTVTNVTYRVTGAEQVTVPAGTFPAWRVEVTGVQPMILFLRQEGPHILLRQEYPGMPVSMELQSIGGN